jgi:hypothetical protein
MFAQQIKHKKITIKSLSGDDILEKDYGKLKYLIHNNNIIYSIMICIGFNSEVRPIPDVSPTNLNNYNFFDVYSVRVLINKINNISDESIVYGIYDNIIQQYSSIYMYNYIDSRYKNIFEEFKTIHIIYRDLFYYLLSIKKIDINFIESNFNKIISLYNDDIEIIIELIKMYILSNSRTEKKDLQFINKIKNKLDTYVYYYFEDITANNFYRKFENDTKYYLGEMLNSIHKKYSNDRYRDQQTYENIVYETKNKFDFNAYNDLIKQCYKYDHRIFYGLSNEIFGEYVFEENKNIVLEILSNPLGIKLLYVPDNYCKDRVIMLEIVKKCLISIIYISDEFKTEEIILEAIDANYNELSFAPYSFRNNKQVVMKATKKDWHAFIYASEDLRNDENVMLEAITINGNTFIYASETIRGNKEIALKAIRNNGYILQDVSNNLNYDRQVVLESVKYYGVSYKYASENLRDDKEIALMAINTSDNVLEYASDTLRDDRQVVLNAVKKSVVNLFYMSSIFYNDKEIIIEAIKHDPFQAIRHASEELCHDKDIVLSIVSTNWYDLYFDTQDVWSDWESILDNIKKNKYYLKFHTGIYENESYIEVVEKPAFYHSVFKLIFNSFCSCFS